MSQDQFNIKKFLLETQSGPYGVIKKTSVKKKSKKSLNENYIDLMPVGGGNTFKGYTNELREDEKYMGPTKPSPDKIYAAPDSGVEEVKDNAWIKKLTAFKDKSVENFIVNYDYPGIITWTPEDIDGSSNDAYYIAATPQWDGPGTPIEAIFPNGDPKTGQDSIMIKDLKQDTFASFQEYAQTVYPIIKKWMDQNSGGEEEMEEDYSVANDDDYDKAGRFWDLGGRQIAHAVENLIDYGFTIEDIIKYIQDDM